MKNTYPEYHEYLQIAHLAGKLSSEEKVIFDQLMKEDAGFRTAFDELQQSLPPEIIASLDQYKDQANWKDVVSELTTAPVKNINWMKRLVAAAAVIGIIGLGIWILSDANEKPTNTVTTKTQEGTILQLADGKRIDLSKSKGTIDAGTAKIKNDGEALSYNVDGARSTGMNSLTTAPGIDYKLTLEDGSVVWLNSATKLDFPFAFTGNTREITIDGEAYIQVAKNAAKPFLVHLPGSTVQVTGTEFNVNTYENKIVKVSLVEGAVSFHSTAQTMHLNKGRQVILQSGKLTEHPFDNKYTLSWTKGLYYFEETPLAQMAQIIPRWYPVKIVIDNTRNDNKRFVGVLNKKKPLASLLKDMEVVADIQSYYDQQGTLHFK